MLRGRAWGLSGRSLRNNLFLKVKPSTSTVCSKEMRGGVKKRERILLVSYTWQHCSFSQPHPLPMVSAFLHPRTTSWQWNEQMKHQSGLIIRKEGVVDSSKIKNEIVFRNRAVASRWVFPLLSGLTQSQMTRNQQTQLYMSLMCMYIVCTSSYSCWKKRKNIIVMQSIIINSFEKKNEKNNKHPLL